MQQDIHGDLGDPRRAVDYAHVRRKVCVQVGLKKLQDCSDPKSTGWLEKAFQEINECPSDQAAMTLAEASWDRLGSSE